jgi:outer membrane protein insertion porin family
VFRWPLQSIALTLVLAGGLLGLWPGTSLAQPIQAGGIIEEVRVEGTQRIEPETVRSYMRINPGELFDPIKIDTSLKSIFATGLFADVTLRREGDTLVVVVVENPIINRIAFEGNVSLDNETLAAETTLRPRVVFTRTKVQVDVQRLIEVYRLTGRFAATVEPKVIELDQNRVDLVFEINEGPVTRVGAISFIGNRAFSDGRLREEITTTEAAFWRIFTTADTYDPDRLTFDRDLLRRFYLSRGYADFRVVSAVAELTPDRESFIITFTLDEGERYTFGEIELTTTLRNLDAEQLRSAITTLEGEWYDASEVEDTIADMTEAAGNLGFAFIDIRARVERDRENLIIHLTFDILEGPRVFVERIEIEGNLRTLDHVIRREFRLVEGDAFNSAKLRRSRTRIRNLGYFKNVEITNTEGSTPDRTVVTVEVEEQSTGDLTFGAGVSSTEGLVGSVSLRERNLLGAGQDLRTSFTLAGSKSQLDLSFTEPYFLDRNLAAGFDLFRVVQDQSESSFKSTRVGGGLRAGYNIQENLRQVWRYTLQQQDISDIDNDASALVKDDEGTKIESSISETLTYDVRDSRFDPREGYTISNTIKLAGFGGSVKNLRSTLGGGYYVPVLEDLTLAFRGEVGGVVGIGQDTRVSDRFFKGGVSSIRGFEFGGVGPRDKDSDDAVGGKTFYHGTAELVFPVGLPTEFKVRGRLFTDFGADWNVDGPKGGIQDSSSPRLSVGTGISWGSPFGPVVLDFGFALVEEDFDKTETFSFSFGTRF